jgi:hypothetical protein
MNDLYSLMFSTMTENQKTSFLVIITASKYKKHATNGVPIKNSFKLNNNPKYRKTIPRIVAPQRNNSLGIPIIRGGVIKLK